MGFGGGGSAGMTAHVHNNVPLQGGPLDFANDTIASLNAGSTTFSDGAALQELVIGNAGETLTVNGGGTAPEWAAGGAAAVWTADGNDVSAGGTAALNVSGMTGRDITQVLFSVGSNATTTAFPMVRVNNLSTGTYNLRNACVTSALNVGYFTYQTGYILDQNPADNIGLQYSGVMYIFKGDPNLPFTGNTMKSIVTALQTDDANPRPWITTQGAGCQTDTNAITQIDLVMSSGNIYGSMQVNSMDYQ